MRPWDDLAAVGCGVIIGKILWWGIILMPAILWLHPWILLVAIWIWWVVAKSRAEEARSDTAARAAEAGREGDLRSDTAGLVPGD